jgi:carbon storage regulator
MLVLSRQLDQTIMIGDDVELTVVDIRGDKVRIGIKAPPHVAVHRKEVYDAIRNENRDAAAFRGELPGVRPGVRGGSRPGGPPPPVTPLGQGRPPRRPSPGERGLRDTA